MPVSIFTFPKSLGKAKAPCLNSFQSLPPGGSTNPADNQSLQQGILYILKPFFVSVLSSFENAKGDNGIKNLQLTQEVLSLAPLCLLLSLPSAHVVSSLVIVLPRTYNKSSDCSSVSSPSLDKELLTLTFHFRLSVLKAWQWIWHRINVVGWLNEEGMLLTTKHSPRKSFFKSPKFIIEIKWLFYSRE